MFGLILESLAMDFEEPIRYVFLYNRPCQIRSIYVDIKYN